MESNICSTFGKISGITESISEFRGVSAISENGQVDKNKVISIMLKNPRELTNEEKDLLSYVEKVLGKDEYAELKEQVVKGEEIKPITFDDIATSPWASGVLGSIDKSIGIGIESTLGKEMSFNDLNEELKKLGYDRSYRRNLLRDIPKEARDIKVAPELPKGLKLAKGFGIASTALAGVTVGEDIKNNDTNTKRAIAIGIDGAGTYAGYAVTGALTDGALAGVTGYVATGVTVVLAPEIAAGVGVAVAGAVVAGAACYIASAGSSTVKGWFGLH